jgi:hypothetical protein
MHVQMSDDDGMYSDGDASHQSGHDDHATDSYEHSEQDSDGETEENTPWRRHAYADDNDSVAAEGHANMRERTCNQEQTATTRSSNNESSPKRDDLNRSEHDKFRPKFQQEKAEAASHSTRSPKKETGTPQYQAGRPTSASKDVNHSDVSNHNSSSSTDRATPSSHRGTLAARALQGRKRVQSAVAIQRWMRRILQQRADAERDQLRVILRKKREAREEEEAKRARLEVEEKERRKAAKEQVEERARQQKEAEIEKAREKLEKRIAASIQANHSPQKNKLKSSWSQPRARRREDDDAETLAQLSTALRVSAERSTELAMTSTCEEDDEVILMCAEDAEADACHDSSFSGRALSPIPKIPSPPRNENRASSALDTLAQLHSNNTNTNASPTQIQDTRTTTTVHSPGAHDCGTQRTSPASKRALVMSTPPRRAASPPREDTRVLDTAARDVQSSIFSFLDAVEADAHARSGQVSAMGSPSSSSHQRTASLSDRSTMPSNSLNMSSGGKSQNHASFLPPASPSFPASPSITMSHNVSGNKTAVIAHQVYGEVKAKMAAMKLELQQRDKAIHDMAAALKEHKERNSALSEQYKEDLKTQLALQRAEYENQVYYHITCMRTIHIHMHDLAQQSNIRMISRPSLLCNAQSMRTRYTVFDDIMCIHTITSRVYIHEFFYREKKRHPL